MRAFSPTLGGFGNGMGWRQLHLFPTWCSPGNLRRPQKVACSGSASAADSSSVLEHEQTLEAFRKDFRYL